MHNDIQLNCIKVFFITEVDPASTKEHRAVSNSSLIAHRIYTYHVHLAIALIDTSALGVILWCIIQVTLSMMSSEDLSFIYNLTTSSSNEYPLQYAGTDRI